MTKNSTPSLREIDQVSGPSRTPIIIVLLLGAFLPPLDFYIVNLALPAIGNGLRTTGGQLQLIVSCYASAYAVFLITGGRLGDLYGRKRMFMTGMAGFIIGLAAGVVTSTLQIGAAVGVDAVGSVFFTVLGQQTAPSAYGDAFASALAVAACLQVLGMLLATKMNHRHRRAVGAVPSAAAMQSSE